MSDFNNETILSNDESIHRSFAGALINGLVSDLIFRRIQGKNQMNLDIFDISLAAIQSGVSHISYRAAVETISHISQDFKKIKEDPKNKSQTIVYIAGGSLGALYATGINYPIDCIREFRNNQNKENKAFKITFNGAGKFYADRVFGYIGFATSMGNIAPLFPKTTSKFQNNFLIQLSRLSGLLTAYPYKMLKYNIDFLPYVKNNLQSCAIKMISSDLSSHFKREIDRIQYIS